MAVKIKSTEAYVSQAKAVHGATYDYSKLVYRGYYQKVTVTCRIHGDWHTLPNNFLAGKGCPICGKYKAASHSAKRREGAAHSFKQRVIDRHGLEKYDLSEATYINKRTKVKIVCKEHGAFWILPYNLINLGHGCIKCGVEEGRTKLLQTTSQFIQKAISVHGELYDYSKVAYGGWDKKVTIICLIHGEFMQRPSSHLGGTGCPLCGYIKSNRNIGQEEYLRRITNEHNNKYNYSKLNYRGMAKKVLIICPNHGEFWQNAGSHLNGAGCIKCTNPRFSKGAQRIDNWLKSNNIEFTIEKKFKSLVSLKGNGNKPAFDFCVPSHNLLIEFDGIQHFKPVAHWKGELGFINLTDNDKYKNQWARDNGWKLLRIPYTQEKSIEQILEQELGRIG